MGASLLLQSDVLRKRKLLEAMSDLSSFFILYILRRSPRRLQRLHNHVPACVHGDLSPLQEDGPSTFIDDSAPR
jgi:hypothetical protein